VITTPGRRFPFALVEMPRPHSPLGRCGTALRLGISSADFAHLWGLGVKLVHTSVLEIGKNRFSAVKRFCQRAQNTLYSEL
jgi:hypothetical protein